MHERRLPTRAPSPSDTVDPVAATHDDEPARERGGHGRGRGQALGAGVRGQMEAAFGADFGAVRVHEGPEADALGARAYTEGEDVHFSPGQYDPASRSGQALIGHELAHVLQQRRGGVALPQGKNAAINHDAALEAEADVAGAHAAAGERAPVSGVAAGGIQRDPWDQGQKDKENALAERLNQDRDVGAHGRLEVGPTEATHDARTERHLDDDMLATVERVLTMLPPEHVNGNPALARVIMKHAAERPESYYSNAERQLTIVVPFDAASWVYLNVTKWPLGDLATTFMASEHPAQGLSRDIVGTGNNLDKLKMVPEKFVEWMLRHETGHAVDAAIGWEENGYHRLPECGGWEIHDNIGAMVDTVAAAVGLGGDSAALRAQLTAIANAGDDAGFNGEAYRNARRSYLQANAGAQRDVEYVEKVIRVGLSSPYENGSGVRLNGRTYQHDPQHGGWLSYASAAYDLRDSNYQFQGPGEWFAETYARYFGSPQAEWGSRVKNTAARDWFRHNLDPVNGLGALIQGGHLVPLPAIGPQPIAGPAPGSAPRPSRMAEAWSALKGVGVRVGTLPLSAITRATGAVVGTGQLAKIGGQAVYRAFRKLVG